ncbi:riboflavin synthase [Halobaculum sp. MBLA0147]|uniref:riboflavin synthase n=1 Tax=Halobaculum sp. MBLA0147 TaxID=3079934 RepID=UPI003526686D
MFTGIVETTGEVVARETTSEGLRLRVAADGLDDLHHGQSIAVSGVCLTVESFGVVDPDDTGRVAGESDDSTASAETDDSIGEADEGVVETDGGVVERDESATDRHWFEVFLAAETVAKTYLDDLRVGDVVNVERALPADGRFDGHLVQGHVDTTAEITGIDRVGEDWRFAFSLPEGFGQYVVGKGSVALDGISLTVAERDAETFEVAIVPTTYEVTNLSEKSVGDPVHLEVDVVAKYVESMLDGYVDALAE